MGWSVIIPSKTATNLVPCIEAVRKHEPTARVIVVDDGLDLSFLPKPEWQPPAAFIQGVKPFIFSRACNMGIAAAGTDDVILLNDDALLQTPRGFTALSMMAEAYPEFGVISAAVDVTGNLNQRPQPGNKLRAEPRMVCFVCVYIPRRAIEKVGLMDERFGGTDPRTGERIYGFCDDDMCLRARRAGFKIGIYDGCVVNHGTLKSTFRSTPCPLEPGRRVFVEKWGAHPL